MVGLVGSNGRIGWVVPRPTSTDDDSLSINENWKLALEENKGLREKLKKQVPATLDNKKHRDESNWRGWK